MGAGIDFAVALAVLAQAIEPLIFSIHT